jgi:antimicrobial peptide system SdpA family protein
MPHNSLRLPGESTARVALLLPEGWKFFTRDPEEPRLRPYTLKYGSWLDASRGPSAAPKYAFGLNRLVRTQGVEMALLLSTVPDSAWTPCTRDPVRCLPQVGSTATIRNPSPLPSLCGTIAFAKQKPVPWAWSNRSPPVVMPSRVLRLEVQCDM